MNQEATQKSRARIVAIVMAGAVLISLMFLVFAFLQKAEADRQTEIAMKNRKIAEENFHLAEKQRQLAAEFQLQLEKARLDLEACNGK